VCVFSVRLTQVCGDNAAVCWYSQLFLGQQLVPYTTNFDFTVTRQLKFWVFVRTHVHVRQDSACVILYDADECLARVGCNNGGGGGKFSNVKRSVRK